MGPRGTSTLERLFASAPDLLPKNTRLKIHIVDPSPPGPGSVWRTDQPPELLMNIAASQVTLFTSDHVKCSGPIRKGPGLYDWATQRNMSISPNDYLTRSQHGLYLSWFFNHTVNQTTANVEVELHNALAISLDNESSGLQKLVLSNGDIISRLFAVILAQGHLPLVPNEKQRNSIDYAKKHSLRYILPSSPADVNLSSIATRESVLLSGLGLCFFDYLSMLTKGRGNEPLIYASSQRGIPYHGRGVDQKGISGRRHPIYITSEIIHHFRKRASAGVAPNFKNEIWPLISNEVQFVYYESLLGQENYEFRKRFIAAQQEQGDVNQVLDDFHVPQNERWSWDHVLTPQGKRVFLKHEWKSWLLEYLKSDVFEAGRGNVKGPLKAALDMLRDLRYELRQIIDNSGLSGDSHKMDLDMWYSPLNSFLSAGPPRVRIQEMIALMEAGILDVLGPGVRVSEKDGSWLVQSPNISDSSVKVTTLVDARLPRPILNETADKLLSYLLKTGQCRQHAVDNYETGGLDVALNHSLIDSQGKAHERRFAIGVPTEGVHWFTTTLVRPGGDSILLRHADEVARNALRRAGADAKLKQRSWGRMQDFDNLV
ncbi:FAD-NAD(P)-binding-domain-containing protein [Annulohypoxylon stygium]|nr:FAD-NAD(P)-binding-domain-containing protein [Annulohypoxylon stygium]